METSIMREYIYSADVMQVVVGRQQRGTDLVSTRYKEAISSNLLGGSDVWWGVICEGSFRPNG